MGSSKSSWLDVSVPIRAGMVHWPSDPGVTVGQQRSLQRGDDANVSELTLGVHTGTHVDAPLHFLPGGLGVDEIPLEVLIGTTIVVDIEDDVAIRARELRRHSLGDRVLFRTRNSARCWSTGRFIADYVYLSLDGAQYLVERGVRLVGIDYLSIGGADENPDTHRLLLANGICIVEGLNLDSVAAGRYEMICLPLRIAGCDGAPARVVLRRSETSSR